MEQQYQPFTYQPMLRTFYYGGRFPQEISRMQAENPAAANHIGAVYSFGKWMQQELPTVYSAINTRSPNLLDPAAVIGSGAIAAGGSNLIPAPKGMSGLGDYVIDPVTGDVSSGPTYTGSGAGNPVSEWGKSILDFGKSLLTYDAQRKLLDVNIKRAERGLSPLDMSQYGMGVNVGLAPGTQNLLMWGMIGIGLVLAVSAVKRR